MSPLWWVEYSGRRTLIEADNVDAADDEAIVRFSRIPDSVYPADEDPDMPLLRTSGLCLQCGMVCYDPTHEPDYRPESEER